LFFESLHSARIGAEDEPRPDPLSAPAPLLGVAVALIGGICLDRFLPAGPVAYAIAFGGALTAAAVLLWRRARRGAVAATLVTMAALGAILHHLQYRHLPPQAIGRLTAERQRLCTLVGTVTRRPHVRSAHGAGGRAGADCRWVMDAEQADIGGRRRAVSGRVAVSCRGIPEPLPALGERIEVIGLLGRPPPAGNPGQWDRADHQRRNGIQALCFANTPEAVRRTDAQPFNVHRLLNGIGSAARAPLARMQQFTGGHSGGRQLLFALLVGDRGELDPQVRDAFVRTGLLHFLAISGLHVGILAGFVWLVCRLLRRSVRQAAAAVIVVALLYLSVASFRPSILRATIVVIVIAVALAAGRARSAVNDLALAAVLMLGWRPADAFDSGFQLCFLVAFSVLVISPRLHAAWFGRFFAVERLRVYGPHRRWVGWLRGRGLLWLSWAASVSVAAWAAGAPLAARTFHVIAPIAPLASIVVFPLVAAAFIVGFIYLLTATWLPIAAAPMAVAADTVARLLNAAVGAFAAVPFGSFPTGGPGLPVLALLYGLALLWLLADRPLLRRLSRGRLRPWHALAACLGVLIGHTAVGLLPRRPEAMTVTCLSVGHGTAVVLECPDGRTILYDAGSSRYGRVGVSVIDPFLRHRGVRRIDALVLSHPDLDHYSGVADLLDRFEIGCIVTGEHFRALATGESAAALLERIDAANVPVRPVAAGDRLLGAEGWDVRVLGPPARRLEIPNDRSARNDASVVLSVRCGDRRVLLPGDIEEIGLEHVLARAPGRHEVMLAAHHGERSALATALIRQVRPAVVIVSGAAPPGGGSLRVPLGVRLLHTDRHGAVTVRIRPHAIDVETFHQRY
jgi:competence protein ComEC